MNNFWLVAEDNENDILLLRRVCTRLSGGLKFHWARDGIEARDYLVKAKEAQYGFPIPSLILSDLNMPLLNGLELLSWVKSQQPQLSEIPFVVFTSSTNEGDRTFAVQLRADDYLIKPGNLNGLSAVIQELQSRWKQSLKPTSL